MKQPHLMFPGPAVAGHNKMHHITLREKIVKQGDKLFGADALYCFRLIDTCLCLHSNAGLWFLDVGGYI